MKPFTVSHIVGYDTHLPIKQVRLPLKYFSKSKHETESNDYHNNRLGHSEFIDISAQRGHFFSQVEAGISRDLKTLRLNPLIIDEATSLGVQFQILEFLLPHPLVGSGTFTYHFVPSETEDEPYIIIDVIDESFLLMTFRIELGDFLMGDVRNRLILDNFNDWVNISVPYSFELRSSPFFMKALDACNIVVSMKDGGLLHFRRSDSLSSVDIFSFSDIAPLVSLNFVGSLFSSTNKADLNSGGLSSNAVLDVVALNDDEFVTLSLNRSVKTYDMKTHKQLKAYDISKVTNSSSEWLTNVPSRYFQVTTYASQASLHLMLPSENAISAGNEPAYQFITWDISGGKLGTVSNLNLRDAFAGADMTSPKDQQSLKLQDYQIVEDNEYMQYYVLFKLNTYSEVAYFEKDKASGNVTQFKKALPSRVSVFEELKSHREAKYYLNVIFNSGLFDKWMVDSALDVFIKNSDGPKAQDNTVTLRQKFFSAVKFVVRSKGISESSAWHKLALLCFEFKRSSQEALSLFVQHDLILCSEVNGIGVYREAHPFEAAFHRPSENDVSGLIRSLSSKLSPKSLSKLGDEIRAIGMMDVSKAGELASKYLCGKFSDGEIGSWMEKLASIPGNVDQINQLIGMSNNDSFSSPEAYAGAAGEGTGLFSKLLMVDFFESTRKCHEALLVDLFVLLLSCEVNATIIDFMNMITRKLRLYSIMYEIFNISFSSSVSSSAIEHSDISSKEFCLFWEVSVKQNPRLRCYIQKKDAIKAFDYYVNQVLMQQGDENIFAVVTELLNRNESGIVLADFVPKMDDAMPLNSFLIGLTYLLNGEYDSFNKRLADYTLFEQVNKPHSKEILLGKLRSSSSIREFLTGVLIGESESVVTKSNYYHQMSQLLIRHITHSKNCSETVNPDAIKTRQVFDLALELESSAISILEESKDFLGMSHLAGLFLRTHFGIAVDVRQFEQAATSLSKLKNVSSKSDYKIYFTRLLKTLIKFNEHKQLFGSDSGSFYADNYLLVDTILLELANEDLILPNALRGYELLYSWRLLGPLSLGSAESRFVDKRGAAEALYMFITRFQSEKDNLGSDSTQSEDFQHFKLKILELYKIILTTLKTFHEEDDKWIRKREGKQCLNVITLTEINIEHFRWLRDLEGDLAKQTTIS